MCRTLPWARMGLFSKWGGWLSNPYTPTSSLPLGVSLRLEGWWPHPILGQAHLLRFSSTDPAGHQGWTGLNRGLADSLCSKPGARDAGQCGKRRWGWDKGSIVRTAERLWMEEWPSFSPRCCCIGRIKRLFSNAAGGGVTGTCFWKAAWQQVLRALKMSLPSTSRNLS